MSRLGEVEINAIVRGARLNRFHILIVSLCTAVAIFDGFATQLLAYVGPMIVRDFHIPFSPLGTLFGASMVALTGCSRCVLGEPVRTR